METPETDSILEAILQNQDEGLDKVAKNTEATVVMQSETNESIKELLPALEAIAVNTEPKKVQKVRIEIDGEEEDEEKIVAFLRGKKGDKGDKGDTGEKGEKGDVGDKGEKGDSIKGDKGDSIQGEKGKKGDKGDKGDVGEKGIDGKNGKAGKNGSPDTAEEIATKINTLSKAIDFKVLKNFPDMSKGGSGLNAVFVDEVTVFGNGLADNPLRAVGGGGSGTPGGSTTQLQYNNAGAFGGITGATTDGTSVTLTAATFATSMTGSYLTDSEILITNASKNIISAPVATYPSLTELSYVKGVTSGIQAQINALSGALTYYGTWNATTNTPTLVSSTGITGQYYVVSVAGTTTLDGISSWSVGDWAIFNGTVWEKLVNGSAVSSVTGTTNRITSTGGSTPVIDISASYVGQASITTLGTITTGVWNGTDIPLSAGGTGATLSDPGANAVFVWDNTTNATRLATLSGLTYDSGTNVLTASGGGAGVTSVGTGDYLTGGPITTTGTINVDNEIELAIVTSLMTLAGL